MANASVLLCWTRLEDGNGKHAAEGVGDVGFEGIGLQAECEVEEEVWVWLATVGEVREKRLRKRHFAISLW